MELFMTTASEILTLNRRNPLRGIDDDDVSFGDWLEGRGGRWRQLWEIRRRL